MSDTIYSRPQETFYSELENAPTGLVGVVGVTIYRKSDSTVVTERTTAGIVETPEGSGTYQFIGTAPSAKGDYRIFWDWGEGPSKNASDDLVVQFELPVIESVTPPSPVTDLRDTRVLIPRTRRALQGPHASAAATPANEFSDEEVNGLIADAIADIILYGGGSDVFGHKLQVTARDEAYMAPTAWLIEPALEEHEGSVVVAQAALNWYVNLAKNLKTSEKIADEGQSWEYEIAATVITQQIKSLREDRDRALEMLKGKNIVTDDYVNFLAERDYKTDVLIEPWAHGGGGRGGQEFVR